jgi:hypothetical protein
MYYHRAVNRKILSLSCVFAAVALAAGARAARAEDGVDFGPQAHAIYRVVGCGGSGALPGRFAQDAKDQKLVAKHCAETQAAMDEYRKKWLDKAMPFFKSLVPAGLPLKVVYPYAGGDMVTALAVYPDATEFTGISLESAGDPRGIDTLKGADLEKNLKTNRHNVVRLMKAAFSATTELAAGESTELPGQLIVAMSGLVVHGYEPVSLRYFTINDDGTLHYITAEEIAAYDKSKKKKGKKGERELRISIFSNAELTFRKAGDPKAPLKVYRHIAANLYNEKFPADGPLMKHLESKGKIAAITKAASHLLWYGKSTNMRDYLLGNMEWMISDATGIAPEAASAAGFEQVTWGRYAGAYFEHRNPEVEKAMIALWAKNPYQELDFRFGYFDKKFQHHLLVTRKKK